MPSTSEVQHNAMEAAAHGNSNLGIPESVGKEFVKADSNSAVDCAGILFKTPDDKFLLIKRSDNGMWESPAGKLELGESIEQAAERECIEEIGSCPQGFRTIAFTHSDDKINFTCFSQNIPKDFTVNINDESTEFGWFSHSEMPSPTHENLSLAIKALSGNEYDVALAISKGELASPQKFNNVWLVDMRVTGTGMAERIKDNSFVFRKPEDFTSDEFLARCNGLPVIMGHPQREDGISLLNAEEFSKKIVGTSFLPYARKNSTWTISKIFDEKAIKDMYNYPMSTSPGIRVDDKTSFKKQIDGEVVLVEGVPELVDHLAIVSEGVWDKNGEPSGINLGENTMKDEDLKEKEEAKADSVTEENAKEEMKSDGVEEVAAIEAIEPDSGSPELKAIHALTAEIKGMCSAMMGVKADSAVMPSTVQTTPAVDKMDSTEDKPMNEEIEALKKEREKDKADHNALLARFEAMNKPQPEEELLKISESRSKYDRAFQMLGEETVKPNPGQTFESFRKMAATKLKKFSEKFKLEDLKNYTGLSFEMAEDKIFADAQEYSSKNFGENSGGVRAIHSKGPAGQTYIDYVGDAHCDAAFGKFMPIPFRANLTAPR
jgi:hypothetical protein